MVEALLARWGYWAVGLGTFLEGETVVLAAGALAHRGLLSLPVVMLAAFLGSVAGDQVWFAVGRRFGRAFVHRRPRWKAQVARVEGWLARGGDVFVVGFRFLYGLRTVTPLLLGASGFSPRRFVVLNLVGGALWAVAFGAGGWAVGATLQATLARSARLEELLAAAVVLALAAWGAGRWWRRRRGASPG
jgi:membrane protein DedA with SNARE-associated domain